MKPTIENLIALPEGKTLEFKRDLSSPRPILKTLLAFANTAGGRLIVGVDDDRHVLACLTGAFQQLHNDHYQPDQEKTGNYQEYLLPQSLSYY